MEKDRKFGNHGKQTLLLDGEILARTRAGAGGQVLTCTAGKTTWCCRNGIYLKAGKRRGEEFTPASNFNLRLDANRLDDDGRLFHGIALRIGDRATTFEMTDEDFLDGRKLLAAATRAGIRARFEVFPSMEDADIANLPSIVKATQLQPPLEEPPIPEMGFSGGRFHGPNFTATHAEVEFRETFDPSTPRPAAWMRPESPESLDREHVPRNDHAALKANQLVQWIHRLDGWQRVSAGVMVYAAIAWLHRGSRQLDSSLLVPSEAHLALLGHLIGLEAIEVGKGPATHQGAPRLMKSPYSTMKQFRRQGRIVVAIEDPPRKIDPDIPVLVHSMAPGAVPEPSSAFLSLFAHVCLGAGSVQEAVDKLVSLVEDEILRARLDGDLTAGADYFVPAGQYLDKFLKAVRWHSPHGAPVIESRGRRYLRRDAADTLRGLDFAFDQQRLIREFREKTGLPQPRRYGRAHVTVFELGEGMLEAG